MSGLHALALGLLLAAPVRVGSKVFTESVVLGEVATRALLASSIPAVHRRELGGTRILWDALERGDLDVYPEYTGTLAQEIFAAQVPATLEALGPALAARGVRIAALLGFSNTYALGMKEVTAERLGIRTISDLARHPELRFAFSNEFLDRGDGWRALQRAYGLPQGNVRGMDHDLAYRGLASGAFEVTDLYSTDAEVKELDLRLLRDDKQHFPDYQALLLLREAAATPEVVAALSRLQGRITQRDMVAMNARAKVDRLPEATIAAGLMSRTSLARKASSERSISSFRRFSWSPRNIAWTCSFSRSRIESGLEMPARSWTLLRKASRPPRNHSGGGLIWIRSNGS